jgi:putative DNA primase/helicase
MNNTIPLDKAKTQNLTKPDIQDSLTSYSLENFTKLYIPPKENILSPILQTQSLSMLYAARGIGKTHISLGIAHAIASGGSILSWDAPKPRTVLYIDGEMPAILMQERLKVIVKTSGAIAQPDYFQILTPDMQELGMPDLSTPEGQARYEPYIENAEFIIIDNISTLARTGKENEAEGWLPIQAWALRMRSRGKSVMFVHHAGKGGQQRGTSRREDVLDLVVTLKRPENYNAQEGARFEVHFEKARNLTGIEAKPFEARLTPNGWTYCDIENVDFSKVIDLHNSGLSTRKIEEETGISKSKASRMINQYKEES